MKVKVNKFIRKEMKILMFVIKRNGSIEEFNREKIEIAIRKALVETKECDDSQITPLSKSIFLRTISPFSFSVVYPWFC